MDILRTPDSRFDKLKDYEFAANYLEVDAGDGTKLRMHYVDEGEGEVILCLHGQPSWSYLYRKMIPLLAQAGYRVVAPDLVGFGKSDKPTQRSDYTYANHVAWMKGFIESLGLADITLVCQDWGSLIGLRVVAENEARFSRVVLANGGLPDGTGIPEDMSATLHQLLCNTPALPAEDMFMKLFAPMEDRPQFMYWVRHCDEHPDFHPAEVLKGSLNHCDEQAYRAWSAPFPSQEYMAGARQFPSLVPIIPDNPAIPANRAAWKALEKFDKPFITAFSDSDPVTKGGEKRFIKTVPGARGQAHTIIKGAGHFLQDDAALELSTVVIDFICNNKG
ncbi:MAG: haloalkane dehalogenase [Gammaproteobacteria bacterium]|jgi:haloalkane dehalogenase|nr:haloalkane dehalogenase [Gammaproteobacteria bacterium]MBT5204625.1 haloalkane dehalogenase [Gammaproteobacteria bacterium]MBT5601410.1 haloalkane dehalogenase [Gammaproteobacteria bacterium]MBT6244468.1 haloalkane dehalogenase [Gammaproteobacteria bacterium]